MTKVLVGGCFDILHYGHVIFLKKTKSLGDYLVVLLESDARIKKLKGDSRPFHNQNQRKEILESLKFVDQVLITKDVMTDKDYADLVLEIKPEIIAISSKSKTITHAEKVGAKVVTIKALEGFSTSKLLIDTHRF